MWGRQRGERGRRRVPRGAASSSPLWHSESKRRARRAAKSVTARVFQLLFFGRSQVPVLVPCTGSTVAPVVRLHDPYNANIPVSCQ